MIFLSETRLISMFFSIPKVGKLWRNRFSLSEGSQEVDNVSKQPKRALLHKYGSFWRGQPVKLQKIIIKLRVTRGGGRLQAASTG